MKLLQINTTLNLGSHGRIVEDLSQFVSKKGNKSYSAAAIINKNYHSNYIKIGNTIDRGLHVLKSRIFDRHGFGSINSTEKLLNQITLLSPDIIHLHNIHGYYLNIQLLFNFLKTKDIPVIWSLHDCWAFTGHCSFFDRYSCEKWKVQCYSCPNKHGYPKSLFIDNSKDNYNQKSELFSGLKRMIIVAPSKWLKSNLKDSILKSYEVKVINNGVNIQIFSPQKTNILSKYGIHQNNVVLGVANKWDIRKGLSDFLKIRDLLPKSVAVVLVGLNRKQINTLPKGITGISQTNSVQELAALYSSADVFVNPTSVDNFPTTNLESLACGTPVITYNTGGSPESIDEKSGITIDKNDIIALSGAVSEVLARGKNYYTEECRRRAESLYNKDERYADYIELYHSLLRKV